MSDLEGYGKIYESTNWGEGVNNNIGWGNVYANLAGGGPKNTIAPVISGTAERGETLTSTTGTWTGTGTITFAYQWQRDNVNISGATSSTYVLVAADDNTSITCVVTATDDEGSTNSSSNAISPILGVPYNLVAPVASGTGQVGQTLSTTDGTWQGIATITFAYQWRRDAVNISGATSSTYTLVADDYATDIDCMVTATNTLGSANQDSNDIANIAGTAPSISGVPTLSGTAKVDSTLTATAASVTGTPTPTTTFQWQRSDNGTSGWANISGATSSTYTAVSADENKYLRVVQTSTNEAGSDTANSASTTQVAAAFTGLLDTYSGAAAAYSLRLLRSDYSGSAIRVRRSDDNEEQDIGFRNNELDTSTLETFSLGSDCFITTWYDQSGGSTNNATQSTAANQPKIVSNGTTITDNSKPCIDFDGSSDALEFEELTLGNSNWYINAVYDSTRTNLEDYLLYGDSGATRIRMYVTTARFYISNNSYSYNVGNHRNTQNLFTFEADNERNLRVYRNADEKGTTQTISVDHSFKPFSFGQAGGSRTIKGFVQEIIIYNSDQSSNRTGIETNINDHYSIYE